MNEPKIATLLPLVRELVPIAKAHGLTLRQLAGFAADAVPVLEKHEIGVDNDIKAGVEIAALITAEL